MEHKQKQKTFTALCWCFTTVHLISEKLHHLLLCLSYIVNLVWFLSNIYYHKLGNADCANAYFLSYQGNTYFIIEIINNINLRKHLTLGIAELNQYIDILKNESYPCPSLMWDKENTYL